MKKGFSLISFILILCFFTTATASTFYPLTTVVIDFDYSEDLVFCVDYCGNVWTFPEIEDWQIGDIASLLMWDSETDFIIDDAIIEVNYGGWVDPETWLAH